MFAKKKTKIIIRIVIGIVLILAVVICSSPMKNKKSLRKEALLYVCLLLQAFLLMLQTDLFK